MSPILLAADVVAIVVLVSLFLTRHGRRDLLVAYLGVNLGVYAVASVLASTTAAGVGLGLGLFGVLSIIRLRSEELTQTEIAYYFGALALGLIAGLGQFHYATAGLMALILAGLAVGDHPRLSARSTTQSLLLDRAHTNPTTLRAHVERVLGGEVQAVTVVKTDLVNDTTLVTVRHTPATTLPAPAAVEATR
jgi:hypothetical protein